MDDRKEIEESEKKKREKRRVSGGPGHGGPGVMSAY